MNNALDPRNPEHFGILASRLTESAADHGVSDRTAELQRFLMITCAVVMAMVLGVCSVSSLDTQIGQVTFASAGWLSLAMTLLVIYAAANYFIHYWCDRSAYRFRKGRALLEGGLGQLKASADEHFHVIGSMTDTGEEFKRELALGDAKNVVLRAVAFQLNTSRRLLFFVYGLIPGILVATTLVALVSQASWQFSAIPPSCIGP